MTNKKMLFTLGVLPLATLPITTIVSCSNDKGTIDDMVNGTGKLPFISQEGKNKLDKFLVKKFYKEEEGFFSWFIWHRKQTII